MQQVGVTADRLNGSSVALAAVEPGACTSEGLRLKAAFLSCGARIL